MEKAGFSWKIGRFRCGLGPAAEADAEKISFSALSAAPDAALLL